MNPSLLRIRLCYIGKVSNPVFCTTPETFNVLHKFYFIFGLDIVCNDERKIDNL